MENQNEALIKANNRKKMLTNFLIFLGVGIIIFTLCWYNVTTQSELKESKDKLAKEQLLNSTCSYKRDSLTKEVIQLSIYKSLTKAMVHRDEATSLLKYKVGDFVFMKRDSGRVVISDIVIGGSKYEYYVKYKVLHKDNSSEEVIPELVY